METTTSSVAILPCSHHIKGADACAAMPHMTSQEIYDTVVTHLYVQGCRSLSEFAYSCAYRGAGNLKCAVGVLIPDALYSPKMDYHPDYGESVSIGALIEEYPGFSSFRSHGPLLEQLQNAHDNADHWGDDGPNEEMALILQMTALALNLSDAVLKRLTETA